MLLSGVSSGLAMISTENQNGITPSSSAETTRSDSQCQLVSIDDKNREDTSCEGVVNMVVGWVVMGKV